MIDISKLITTEQKIAREEQRVREQRVSELKKLLNDSDYKVLPDYDKSDGEIIVQRQMWRDEIRVLE